MLILARKMRELSFSALMEVYRQSNLEKANLQWKYLPVSSALRQAEQEFYQYLNDVFFRTDGAVCAIWEEEGSYLSSLRLEPYRNGFLLEALETHPDYRRQGYGKKLMDAILEAFPGKRIYSHIHRKNIPSQHLHRSCGFIPILDYAVYIDGSVDYRADTYLHE